MTDKSNNNDNGLQSTPKGSLRKDPDQEVFAESTVFSGPERESITTAEANNEQNEIITRVAQDPDGHNKRADEKNRNAAEDAHPKHQVDDKPYSVFTHNEKRIVVFCAGLCAFFSPVSSSIYFPSLDAIATDLHVSYSLVNLTITTYMASTPIYVGITPRILTILLDHARSRACVCWWLF